MIMQMQSCIDCFYFFKEGVRYRYGPVTFSLRSDHELRQKAISRFLKEELTILAGASYGKLKVDISKEKGEILDEILQLYMNKEDIKKTMLDYIEKTISLEQLHTKLLPYIIAVKLNKK